MAHRWLLPLLATLSLACSSSPSGDDTAASDDAIIGGAPAESDRFLAVASLVKPKTLDDGSTIYKPFCTATLIAPDLVITANHCVATENLEPSALLVAFGPKSTAPRKTAAVASFERKGLAALPGDVMTAGEDVILMRLAAPVTDIAPIDVGSLSPIDVGRPFLAVGYGFSDGPRTQFGVRLMGPTKVVALRDAFETEVGVRADGDARICQGDSGGPLLAERDGKLFITAILSRGELDARGECSNPATYVRLVARACGNGARIGETTCAGDVWKRCQGEGSAAGPTPADVDCGAASPPRTCDPTARGFACKAR
jgi:hypothetical protein